MTANISVVEITALDLQFAPKAWDFAKARRPEIDAHFVQLQQQRPKLWNGDVLLAHEHAIFDGALKAKCLQTDFASFLAWRDWNFPDPGIRNFFALAALRGSDGAFLAGVMGGHTVNAGKVYFPGGTPDPDDIREGRIDLEGSVRRELQEETGLTERDFDIAQNWVCVLAGPRIALLKIMQGREPAERLRERVRETLAAQAHPELADIRVIRDEGDLDPKMPEFMPAFLAHVWAGQHLRR